MRARRLAAATALTAVLVPIGPLVVRAFADVWRAPAVVPQEWGLRGFDAMLHDPAVSSAALTSLLVAAVTVPLSVAVAWPAARVLGERRLRHPAPIFLLLALPLLVPPYAVGTGLAEWYLRLGIAGSFGGLVLAHLTMALPYAVLVLLSAFGPEVIRLEEMARANGLAPWQRLLWVTAPTVRPTLAAALLLTFLVSWSQYGTSLAVAPARATLPVVMVPFVGNDPQIASTLALLFLVPAVAVLLVTLRALRSPA